MLIQDNVQGHPPGRVKAPLQHLACTGHLNLGRVHMHTSSLTTGLEEGLLDAGIGPTQDMYVLNNHNSENLPLSVIFQFKFYYKNKM